MDERVHKEAFVTLATNDIYCKGASVLAQSLRIHGTNRDIVILITPQVTPSTKFNLDVVFDRVVVVDVLNSHDSTHLALLKRPELGVTFTKLHCWTLTEYEKCVFMDADTLVLSNIDELFSYEELSAAPDAGWPDMFNSGVFVFKPCMDTYFALISLAEEAGSFDGADQGLLNNFFNTWLHGDAGRHLSFLYNMHSNAIYTYLPAFTRFGHNTKVVHFTGEVKPWHFLYDPISGSLFSPNGKGVHHERFVREWWNLHSILKTKEMSNVSTGNDYTTITNAPTEDSSTNICNVSTNGASANITNVSVDNQSVTNVTEESSTNMCNVSTNGASANLNKSTVHSDKPPDDVVHQWKWRTSNVDYKGEDKYDNLQRKMNNTLKKSTPMKEPEIKIAHTPPSEKVPLPQSTLPNNTTISLIDNDSPVSSESFACGSTLSSSSMQERFENWKRGEIDFYGTDKFTHIQSLLDDGLNLST